QTTAGSGRPGEPWRWAMPVRRAHPRAAQQPCPVAARRQRWARARHRPRVLARPTWISPARRRLLRADPSCEPGRAAAPWSHRPRRFVSSSPYMGVRHGLPHRDMESGLELRDADRDIAPVRADPWAVLARAVPGRLRAPWP